MILIPFFSFFLSVCVCVYVSRTYVFINQTSCDVKDITKTDVPVIYISSRECLKKKKNETRASDLCICKGIS